MNEQTSLRQLYLKVLGRTTLMLLVALTSLLLSLVFSKYVMLTKIFGFCLILGLLGLFCVPILSIVLAFKYTTIGKYRIVLIFGMVTNWIAIFVLISLVLLLIAIIWFLTTMLDSLSDLWYPITHFIDAWVLRIG